MQKLWPKKLELNYSSDVVDIVQFGSSVKENSNPNDLDIAVLFKSLPLKEQLNQSQNIKKQIQRLSNINVHIKSFDLYSFFDKSNFAKEGILMYGKSIITGKNFSRIFGMEPKIHILYNLKSLKKKDKVRFNYMLSGKKGEYGLLRKFEGKIISPGLIEILPEYEDIFVEAIKKITPAFLVKKILLT